MAFYQNNQLQQEIEEFKKNIGLNNSNTPSFNNYNQYQKQKQNQHHTQLQDNRQQLPQQSYFLPQQQYNQKPDKYGSNDQNNNEKEFRDDINEKVNNLKFALPTQTKAQHFFDSSIIENNPQYRKVNDDISRRDCRDGMNNRMDFLMFQQFQSQSQPQQQQFQYQPQSHQQSEQTLLINNNNQSGFMNQLPNNFNNFFQQTSRVTNRDSNNERIQEFTSLPRALNQPTQMIDTRPMISPYKSSYQDNHKQFNQYQDPTQNQSQQQYQYQNQNMDQGKYEQYYNQTVLNNESFLRKNESGRNNYKDAHNTRLQELSPLSRTCALPATTIDYTKSVQQSNSLFDEVKTFKKNDMENRQELAEQRKQEWQRMSNNLIHVGKPPTIVVNNNRPMDTRQL